MKSVKKLALVFSSAAILLTPNLSFATTIDDIQAQIQSIVQQVNQIQIQITALGQNQPASALAESKETLLPVVDIKSASIDEISSLIRAIDAILAKFR